MSEIFITVDDLAEDLKVPKSWLYHRTRTNEIPHYKVGKYIRFKRNDVMEWLKDQQKE